MAGRFQAAFHGLTMIRQDGQQSAAFEGERMDSAERERFERTDALVDAVLILKQQACRAAVGVGPRPVRNPAHNWGLAPHRRPAQASIRIAEQSEAVRGSQEDQPPAAQKSLRLESAFTQGPRQVRQAACPSQSHHLLPHLEPFEYEAKELRGAFLPAYHKLASIDEWFAGTCESAQSSIHKLRLSATNR